MWYFLEVFSYFPQCKYQHLDLEERVSGLVLNHSLYSQQQGKIVINSTKEESCKILEDFLTREIAKFEQNFFYLL